MSKSPYDIVKSRYVTEKSGVMEQLQWNTSNACVKRCDAPKYVFLVDKRANKQEIAAAIESIYAERNVRVVGVNTVLVKPKKKRMRGRGKMGLTSAFKKAIVTLQAGNSIEDKK